MRSVGNYDLLFLRDLAFLFLLERLLSNRPAFALPCGNAVFTILRDAVYRLGFFVLIRALVVGLILGFGN